MSQQAQPAGPCAPDPPAVMVTSNVQKYSMKKKKVLSAEEAELFELTQAAGVTVDQEVFKIILDLLKMNVAPQAVFQTLKAMCAGQRVGDTCGDTSTSSHTASISAAGAAEPREEDSGRSPKPSAAPPSASGPRATRVSAKTVVYGPQDASSAAPVRSKAAASHGDKSREASSQRVQRQPSATRGQKSKSSGSSSSSSQINST